MHAAHNRAITTDGGGEGGKLNPPRRPLSHATVPCTRNQEYFEEDSQKVNFNGTLHTREPRGKNQKGGIPGTGVRSMRGYILTYSTL